jgi:hypothetical protein
LVFTRADDDGIYTVVRERLWKPSENPLRPSIVFREAMREIEAQGAEAHCSDSHYLASVLEVTEDEDIEHVEFPGDAAGIARAFVRVRVLLGAHRIDLSAASEQLITELKQTVGKPGRDGCVHIDHPRRGSSHGDCARAFVSSIYALELASSQGFLDGSTMTGRERRMPRKNRHQSPYGEGYMRDLPSELPPELPRRSRVGG